MNRELDSQGDRPPVSAVRPGPSSALPAAGVDWLAHVLDQVDYGIALVDFRCSLLFANAAGRRALQAARSLALHQGVVRAARPDQEGSLRRAIDSACGRGLRALLAMGAEGARHCVAIVPVPAAGAALLMIGKPQMCEELSIQGFARCNGLTPSEAQVLSWLCRGESPVQIAGRLGVAVCTIRSHVGAIRAKTGARSIGALVQQVATLPPVLSVLEAPPATACAAEPA